MKIVINKCYGGFGISDAALSRYNELAGTALGHSFEIDRSDAKLVAVVEEMGENSFGDHAELKVVEIPDGVEWVVEEYDGLEWVAEKHRTWS